MRWLKGCGSGQWCQGGGTFDCSREVCGLEKQGIFCQSSHLYSRLSNDGNMYAINSKQCIPILPKKL